MVPRLDEDGNSQRVKKPRDNGKAYKEQRTTLNVLHEHYIVEKKEQESFIKSFAVNVEDYDYGKFLRDVDKEPMLDLMEPEKHALIDEQGKPLVKG